MNCLKSLIAKPHKILTTTHRNIIDHDGDNEFHGIVHYLYSNILMGRCSALSYHDEVSDFSIFLVFLGKNVAGFSKPSSVGIYGTRSVVGIGMIVIGSDRQILLIYDDDDPIYVLVFRGNPLFLAAFAWPRLFGRSIRQYPTNELYLVPTTDSVV